MAKILLIEPFFGGSHRAWAEGFQQFSSHKVEFLTLSAHHWKWRMHGGAVTLAKKFMESDFQPDLILATDMLDLTTFLSLTRSRTAHIPTVLYFHENQLAYPWSPTDEDPAKGRDFHYIFINYVSALTADAIAFNSAYNRDSFLSALPQVLARFPDHQDANNVTQIKAKSRVLPLGLDLRRLDKGKEALKIHPEHGPLILWNHRWEHDKNPESFFQILFQLQDEGLNFRLAVMGEQFPKQPAIFLEARKRLSDDIVHWGFVKDHTEYAQWLWKSDILPVTTLHDFFGISVIEAMYCGCLPILPDRLAYPEHFPPEVKQAYFYQSEAELAAMLRSAILEYPRKPQTDIRTIAQKYDWNKMIREYDEFLAIGD